MFNNIILYIFFGIDSVLIVSYCYLLGFCTPQNRKHEIIGCVLMVALVSALIFTALLFVCVDTTTEQNVEIDNTSLFVLVSPVEVTCYNSVFNNTEYVDDSLLYNYYFTLEPLWYTNTNSYLVKYGDATTVVRLGVFSNSPYYSDEKYILKLYNTSNSFTEIDLDSLDFDTLSNQLKFMLMMRDVSKMSV